MYVLFTTPDGHQYFNADLECPPRKDEYITYEALGGDQELRQVTRRVVTVNWHISRGGLDHIVRVRLSEPVRPR